jgi:glycerol-3-phosphate acyltransferase PlsY
MMLFAAVVLGYLVGSFPTGYLIGRSRGVDVRKFGSGGTGGTNVLRTLGKGAAITTGVVDVLKGTLGAYIGYKLAGDWAQPLGYANLADWGYALGGIAALVGHSYPIWLGFKGGKSVATAAGALALFYWPAFLVGLAVGIPTIAITRWVSLGSLLGGLAYCGAAVFMAWPDRPSHILLIAIAYGVVVVRHLANIKRIMNGTENRFGEKAKEIKP